MRIVLLTGVLALAGCVHVPRLEIPAPPAGGSRVVVTDIDGTLTDNVWATYQARPGAAETLQAFAGRGYHIVYLSTRVPWLQAGMELWLSENGFPKGDLHVAQGADERDDARAYKARMLREYARRQWTLDFAFGDSMTDFEAYADAGIAEQHVYALRRVGASRCEPGRYAACLTSWNVRLVPQ
jgi:phosphatidate phosphatase PAH1